MTTLEHPAIGGTAAIPFAVPVSRWDAAHAATLTPEALLLYRSNLLGSDLTVTNFGGGNTSAKLNGIDPLAGTPVDVLWVKGSGGDIGSMKLDEFSTLYQAKLLALEMAAPPASTHRCIRCCRLRMSIMSIPMRSSRWPHRRAAKRPRARSGAGGLAGCHGSAPGIRSA